MSDAVTIALLQLLLGSASSGARVEWAGAPVGGDERLRAALVTREGGRTELVLAGVDGETPTIVARRGGLRGELELSDDAGKLLHGKPVISVFKRAAQEDSSSTGWGSSERPGQLTMYLASGQLLVPIFKADLGANVGSQECPAWFDATIRARKDRRADWPLLVVRVAKHASDDVEQGCGGAEPAQISPAV